MNQHITFLCVVRTPEIHYFSRFFQYIRIKMTYIKWLKYATNNLLKNLGHFHTWSPFFSWVQQLRMTFKCYWIYKVCVGITYYNTNYFGKHITSISEQIRAMTHWCEYATGSPPIQRQATSVPKSGKVKWDLNAKWPTYFALFLVNPDQLKITYIQKIWSRDHAQGAAEDSLSSKTWIFI